MKKILIPIMVTILIIACQAQPKSDYELYGNTVTGAVKYHFFLEKKSATAYKLTQGMDYLSPSVNNLKVGESTTPVFMVNLANDGSEYTVGIVAENSAGYYSGMGVAVGTVGISPAAPGGVGLRKK